MKQNREPAKVSDGFSLVEMIILIAIMSILVGLTALGIGMLNSVDAKDVAYGIEGGLTKLKAQNTAGEKPVYMHIYMAGGKYYRIYTDSTADAVPDGTEQEMGDSSISLKVTYDVKNKTGAYLSDREVTVSESGTKDICIGISKKDGTFLYQKVSGTDNSEAPREIQVTSDGSQIGYLVYMVTDTGKHYVEVQ